MAWLTTGRDEPTSGIAAEYDVDQAAEDAILSALPPAPGAGGPQRPGARRPLPA